MTESKKPTCLSTFAGGERARILVSKGVPYTTSLAISEHFEKEHFHLMRDIRAEIEAHGDLSYTDQHFVLTDHVTERGKRVPIFRLSETGFCLIVMGFTGVRATRWKRVYTQTFMEMRNVVQSRVEPSEADLHDHYQQMRTRMITSEMEVKTLLKMNEDLREDNARLEKMATKLQVQQILADELLSEGDDPNDKEASRVYLKGLVADSIAENMAKERQFKEELQRAQQGQTRPDIRRLCASEIFLRLLVSMDFVAGNACVLWALLQCRAFDAPVRVHSKWSPKDSVLNPRKATMNAIMQFLKDVAERETLYQAALRLQKAGLVEISHDPLPNEKRPLKFYQLRIAKLAELLEQTNFDAMLRPLQGGRTEISLSDGANYLSSMLMLDEFEGYVGSRALGYTRRDEYDDEDPI